MNWKISEKSVIVTGGTSGIGLKTAQELAGRGAEVIITSRAKAKAEATARKLSKGEASRVSGLELDLSNLNSIRSFVSELSKKTERVDVLINNAGTITGRRIQTADGFEYTFASNYLGPFLLTNLLLPKLEVASSSRILNLSSELYRGAKRGLDFSDLQLSKRYSPSKAYANSKLAMMLFTFELRQRFRDRGIEAFAIHPGVVKTNFGSGENSSKSMALMMKVMGPFLKSAEQGAETSVLLATSQEVDFGGNWYWSEGSPIKPSSFAQDGLAAAKLWSASEKFLGLDQ